MVDAMTPATPRTPGTPSTDVETGHSPIPPRNDQADADLSAQRKRPRLDGGERINSGGPGESPVPLRSPRTPHTPPPHASNSAAALDGTPSRVTINVRRPVLQVSPDRPRERDVSPDIVLVQTQAEPPSPVVLIPDDPETNVEVVDSSTLSSPKIEVADPEDILPVHATVTLDPIHELRLAQTHFEEFPYNSRDIPLEETLERIQNYLIQDDTGKSPAVLRAVVEWIEKYLELTESLQGEWFELHAEYRDFWDAIPFFTSAIMTKSPVSYHFITAREGRYDQDPAVDVVGRLLKTYALLTARVFCMDAHTLHNNSFEPSAQSDLLSPKYLNCLSCAVRNQETELLVKDLQPSETGTSTIMHNCMDAFMFKLPEGSRSLTEFTLNLLKRPVLEDEALHGCLETVRALVFDWSQRSQEARSDATMLQEARVFVSGYFEAVNENLQELVKKQSPALRLESLRSIHRSLGGLLTEAVSGLQIAFVKLMPTSYGLDSDNLDLGHRAYLMTAAWRMMVLKECIMRGHMDARVFGVNEMNDLLLNAYHRYYKDNSAADSLETVIRYLADFLHQHEIIHYLLGVDSHRQLVSRSKNIVLFLGVTKQYHDSDTDIIWETIRTGQDPRVVEVIVHLVKELLHHCDRLQLIHYMNKFLDLPVAEFNSRLRDLCHSIMNQLLRCWDQDDTSAGLAMNLYALFVRLSQEVYMDAELAVVEKCEIRYFAHNQLQTLITANQSSAELKSILAKCLSEMSRATPKACGSAHVVRVILESGLGSRHLPALQKEFNFAEEVIKDMTRLREMEEQLQVNLNDFQETVTDRFAMIANIIINLPSALTEELTTNMWKGLVGERALNDNFRNAAWAILGDAISHCGPDQQPLIDQILNKHFPSLEPPFFTFDVLTFADRITEYEVRMAKTNQYTLPAPSLRAEDMLWSIALKTISSDLAATSIDRLVHHQLDAAMMLRSDRDVTKVYPYTTFIDRAIQTLISSAVETSFTLTNGNSNVEDFSGAPSLQTISAHAKRRALRSLTILRRFVEEARCKTAASPEAESVKSYGASSQPGNRTKVLFQAHASGKHFEKAELEIGDLATLRDLTNVLLCKTGFRKLNIIVAGRKIDITGQAATVLRDVPNLFAGLVLVQKLPADNFEDVASHAPLSPLDGEVMKQFHAMYDLLDVDVELGNAIYGFLSIFPPHEDVVAQVCNMDPAHAFELPVSSTFKCLYCLFALQTNIARVNQEGLSRSNLIGHGVHLISSAVLSLEPGEDNDAGHRYPIVLNGLVAALVAFLKEPVPDELSATYFSQPEALIDRLTVFLTRALKSKSPLNFVKPIEIFFMAILGITLHSPALRSCGTSRPELASLVKTMLLQTHYAAIREAAKRSLESLIGALSRLQPEEIDHVFVFLWESLNSWIPEACQQPYLAEQFFAFALTVFRNLSTLSRARLPLNTYAAQWSTILSEHRHFEFVGRRMTNYAVLGVASLLRDCISKVANESSSVCMSDDMLERIFQNLLFPNIALENESPTENGRMPVLNPTTRARLYSVLLGDAVDMQRLQRLVDLSGDLFNVDPPSTSWSWGLAQPLPESGAMDPNRAFDGTLAIRSPTGYSGLRNLSNTCYMNALLTQLFMNQDFRDFILSLDVAKPHTTQRLVYEIQRVFVYLQRSWLHAIDPENVAEAIVTYDGSSIDVTVQMDVDEFYNLLFDRLENQMSNNKDKMTLRHFYGGSIIQQIKSKDCPHISERTESFQAIQCEILGKTTLEESLEAYVEGEIMEGDNKYSCSSCGEYVNAVKRACLNDVPENLIFHLKRFDYDLATGMRSKINDYFQFPAEIDMGPFKIDHLKDTSVPAKADRFSLVGVLVHTGQAESGHYYSYIRDRTAGPDTWLEFNDSEVSYFDLKTMQSSSFGGVIGGCDDEPFMKPWNAYMLFYRRRDSLQSVSNDDERIIRPSHACPSLDLSNQIRIENESFLRKYSMFDDQHGFFVTALLEKYIMLKNTSACSDGHRLERRMVDFAFQYMDQVFSRQKDSRHALPVLQVLRQTIEGCGDCAKTILIWFIEHNDGFQDLLLKCPMEKERRAVIGLIGHAVHIARESTSSSATSLSVEDDRGLVSSITGPESVSLLCKAVSNMLSSVHQYHRAFDDFFGLLCDIAALGSFERNQLRSFGVLRHVLQILAVYASRQCARMWPQFQPLLKTMEKRHISLRKLIVLTECLIREAEMFSEASSSEEESPSIKVGAGLSDEETRVLSMKTYKDSNAPLAVLEAVFQLTSAEPALSEHFVATLLHTTLGEQQPGSIVAAIMHGCRVEPATASEPWFRGAIGFIENSNNMSYIKAIIKQIAEDVNDLDETGGMTYLNFFERFRRAHNPTLLAQQPLIFKMLVLQLVPQFGPILLLHQRADVRIKTLTFLQTVLEESQEIDDERYTVRCRNAALMLCHNCVELIDDHERQHLRINVRRIDAMQQMLRYFLTDMFTAEDTDTEDLLHADLVARVPGALDALEAIATSSPDEVLSGNEEESDSGVTECSRDETLG